MANHVYGYKLRLVETFVRLDGKVRLYLIGWESSVRFSDQSKSVPLRNQCDTSLFWTLIVNWKLIHTSVVYDKRSACFNPVRGKILVEEIILCLSNWGRQIFQKILCRFWYWIFILRNIIYCFRYLPVTHTNFTKSVAELTMKPR